MLIHVGIMGNNAGWRTLLRQEGVPHSPVTGTLSPGEFSAVVASGGLEQSALEALRNFLGGGGGLVCTGGVYAQLSGGRTGKAFTRYLLGDKGTEFFDPELTDVFAESEIPSEANCLRSDRGLHSAFVGEFGGGHLVVLPIDPAVLALDRRAATKSFYAANRRLPFERVSLVSKAGLLKIVSRALMILHHRRGLPYVHRWHYPSDQRSVFALRIDTDYADRAEIAQLHDLARRSDVPLTWFVDVGSQRNFFSLFSEMSADEVGIHCFFHRAYRKPQAYAENIRRAVHEFESAGLDARSYAAPFGLWDELLGEAVEQFKFCYSSEFSYDYDNVPSFPYLGRGFLSTLQVPIHPISIGSLRRQGFREDEMISYFRSVIDRKVQAREPVFLYHHPKNGHLSVLESIFQLVKERGLQPFRMIDYASWWKKRDCEGWRIAVDGSWIRVEIPPGSVPAGPGQAASVPHAPVSPGSMPAEPSPSGSGDPWLHIIRPDGMEAFHSMSPALELGQLEWQRPPSPPALPSDIARIRRFNPWIPIIRTEDRIASLFRL